ncbi:MAG: hypothetical protein GPJ54_11065 [Candidatus Heimdallarchaeota archaeon]|nr:hypothetical protein [Candidatus Heimdallarchaeota archaeon]
MYNAGLGDPMPADKLMRLFIIQSISSFVAGDHESGLHYLNEVKQTYAQYMMNLNPTLKSLAKEIISSLDLLDPGANATDLAMTNIQQPTESQPEVQPQPEQEDQESSSVTSELQNLLNRRRAKKNK